MDFRKEAFKNNSLIIAIIMMGILIVKNSWSAPHPASSSSLLTATDRNWFLKSQGFSLDLTGQNWKFVPEKSKTESGQTILRYSKAGANSLELAIHSRLLNETQNLENYSKKWIKEYVLYGFEVHGVKTFQQNNERGLVIDLSYRKKDRRSRQVVFLKEKRVVVISCISSFATFDEDLKGCNKVIKGFHWEKIN